MKRKSKQKKRATRGQGYLYKRKGGKDYPADSKVEGTFYLEYDVSGKKIKQRLTDKDGNAIENLGDAKKERARIMAPFRIEDEKLRLEVIKANISILENDKALLKETAPPLTIQNAWSHWREFRSDLRRKSPTSIDMLNRYHGYWRIFCKWLEEDDPSAQNLCDIKGEHVDRYTAYLVSEKLTAKTYNKHIAFLKNLFGLFLHQPTYNAHLSVNPFAVVERRDAETQSRRELTVNELHTIINKAEGELKLLLVLGATTGLRMGDCVTLLWSEVDIDRGLIIRKPNKIRRKGDKSVKIGIPKLLHDFLIQAQVNERVGYVLPGCAEKYQHNSETSTNGRFSSWKITGEIQKHLTDCGIRIHKEGTGEGTGKRAVVEVGFHSLRHTFVSLHANKGTAQSTIQHLVGHGSPAMTKHYTHLSDDTVRNAAKVLDVEITDAEYEVVDTIPAWISEKLEQMNENNWQEILSELTGASQ